MLIGTLAFRRRFDGFFRFVIYLQSLCLIFVQFGQSVRMTIRTFLAQSANGLRRV